MNKIKLTLALLLISAALFTELNRVDVIKQTADYILLEIDTSDLVLKQFEGFTDIVLEKMKYPGESSKPALPYLDLNIAIPPNGDIDFKVLELKKKNINLENPVKPVPQIEEHKKTHKFIHRLNQEKYEEALKKDRFITKHQITRYRYNEYIPLLIKPITLLNSTKQISHAYKITIEINIKGQINYSNRIIDKLEPAYEDFFLNYDYGRHWKTKIKTEIGKLPLEKSDFWYKIRTNKPGWNYISRDFCKQLPDFVNLQTLRLFTGYFTNNHKLNIKEIPIFIEHNNSEQSIAIIFNTGDSRNQNTYWLTFGGKFVTAPLHLKKKPAKTLFRVQSMQKVTSNRIKDEQTDCIIIVPQHFVSMAQTLAEFQTTTMNIKSTVYLQEDILNEYANGMANSYGIRNFLQSSFENFPEPAPQYVILFGSGSYEGANESITIESWYNLNSKNNILTFNESDDNFVDFYTSNHPEMSVGRIPAQNSSEANFYLERTQKYVTEPTPGFWKNRVMIVADDEYKGSTYESGNFNHSLQAQQAEDIINRNVIVDKIMALEYEFDEYNNKPGVVEETLARLKEGRLIWYYIGHGHHDIMGDEQYFRGSLHMQLMDNKEHLPLMIAASCSVGEFDNPSYNSIGDRIIFLENGGAISSIAATRGCTPVSNTNLIKYFLEEAVNRRYRLGISLLSAKLNSDASYSNSRYYHILGNPTLSINPPTPIGNISFTPAVDSIRPKGTYTISSTLGQDSLNINSGLLKIYDSDYNISYTNWDLPNDSGDYYHVEYKKNGNYIYNGQINSNNMNYAATFTVPEDSHHGDSGRIISFFYDTIQQAGYTNYYAPLIISKEPVDTINTIPPEVKLWLESKDFVSGDHTSTNPLLIAEISDENGINISGVPGRNILLLLDQSTDNDDLINITSSFIYEPNSHTQGSIEYQLNNLQIGNHSLELYVYDNFGNLAVAETEFITEKSGKVKITDMLPYPNPMSNEGKFTFVLTEPADVTINIYTISGKKIRTLSKNCGSNYNEINWDCRDGSGDKIANNTYFYKLKAKSLSGKVSGKIGKVIIFK